jgi:hypothetical protein
MKPEVCSLTLLFEENENDVTTLKTLATNQLIWNSADIAVGRLVHQKCAVRIPAIYTYVHLVSSWLSSDL